MDEHLSDVFWHHSPFAIRHSLGFSEPLFDHRLQRRADQFGDEFGGRVVGARASALRAEGQLEAGQRTRSVDLRVVLQEAFVHRAEFLDVQRGVVDPAGRRGGRFAVVRQMPERLEEVAVGDGAVVQCERRKEFSVQGRSPQEASQSLVGEHLPQHPQAAPQIVVLGVGAATVEQAAQPRHAVVLAVEGIGADQAPILGNQEEQETVHQAQQLAVELF